MKRSLFACSECMKDYYPQMLFFFGIILYSEENNLYFKSHERNIPSLSRSRAIQEISVLDLLCQKTLVQGFLTWEM